MNLHTLNIWAVIAAAVSAFLIGGLWYSPVLFQRPWMRANRFESADLAHGGRARTFGLAFLFALVMAIDLAMFLNGPGTTAAWGAAAGGLSALWVVLAIATTALFERRSFSYVAINAGYWFASFVVMGAILGAWR